MGQRAPNSWNERRTMRPKELAKLYRLASQRVNGRRRWSIRQLSRMVGRSYTCVRKYLVKAEFDLHGWPERK